ncbi:MAG: hypothetical protein COS88_02675, partial [Chloroflexi bacterium CG07_land_8_20_14_0_80_51_10]
MLIALLLVGALPAFVAGDGSAENEYAQFQWQTSISKQTVGKGEGFYATLDIQSTVIAIPSEYELHHAIANAFGADLVVYYDVIAQRTGDSAQIGLWSDSISKHVNPGELDPRDVLQFSNERIPTTGFLAFPEGAEYGNYTLYIRLTRVQASTLGIGPLDVTTLIMAFLPSMVELGTVMLDGGSSGGGSTPTPTPTPTPGPIFSNTGEISLATIVNPAGLLQVQSTLTSEDGKSTVVVAKDTRALDKDGNPLSQITCRPPATPAPAPADNNVIAVYDLGPNGATFNPPITVTMKYDPAELPQGVAETDLVLAYYDVTAGVWVPLTDIVVDTVNHTVSGKTSHFTQFAVLSPTAPPPVKYALTVAVDPIGSGTVTLSPVQPAGGYDVGTVVTLTARANVGYTFDHWSGDASGTSAATTVTMNSDKNVTAHFSAVAPPPVKYTLTVAVDPAGGGRVSLDPPQPADGYDAWTAVTLTATANAGYIFDHWSGDASGTGASTTLIMNSDKSITAHFTEVVPPDVIAPEVVAVSPENGAKNV